MRETITESWPEWSARAAKRDNARLRALYVGPQSVSNQAPPKTVKAEATRLNRPELPS